MTYKECIKVLANLQLQRTSRGQHIAELVMRWQDKETYYEVFDEVMQDEDVEIDIFEEVMTQLAKEIQHDET